MTIRPLLLALLLLLPSLAQAQTKITVVAVGDDMNGGQIQQMVDDGFEVVAIGAESPATPNIDTIADSGTRLVNFVTAQVCTPTRAMLMRGRPPSAEGNLFAHATTPNHDVDGFPSGFDLDDPFMLPRQLKDAGVSSVSYYGKLHLESKFTPDYAPEQTAVARMGFDDGGVIIASNPGSSYTISNNHLSNLCVNHNWWYGYSFDGTVTQYGDGTPTEAGFTNAVIVDAALVKINALITADDGNHHFVFIGLSAPHGPWASGAGSILCDYVGDDSIADSAPDSRPPSFTPLVGASDADVYRAQVQDLDARIGEIRTALAGVASNLIFFGDNGTPNGGATTECSDSYGVKGTVFPCGVVNVALFEGTDFQSTGTNAARSVTALTHILDMAPTLIDLAGGAARDMEDGQSFLDCLDGTISPDACPAKRKVGLTQEWSPIGGTSGTMATPPQSTDNNSEVTRHETSCYVQSCEGAHQYLIHRIHDVETVSGDALEFCEKMYTIASTTDYTDNTVAATAETDGAYDPSGFLYDCNGTTPNGGKLDAADFGGSPSVGQQCALDTCQPYLDALKLGTRPGSAGVTF